MIRVTPLSLAATSSSLVKVGTAQYTLAPSLAILLQSAAHTMDPQEEVVSQSGARNTTIGEKVGVLVEQDGIDAE